MLVILMETVCNGYSLLETFPEVHFAPQLMSQLQVATHTKTSQSPIHIGTQIQPLRSPSSIYEQGRGLLLESTSGIHLDSLLETWMVIGLELQWV